MDKRHFLISNVFHRQHNIVMGSMLPMSYGLNRPTPDCKGLNHSPNIIPTNASWWIFGHKPINARWN